MTSLGFLQIALFFVIIFAITPPLGWYMTRIYSGEGVFLSRLFRPIETVFYRIAGVQPDQEQRWTEYTACVLAFNFVCFLTLYGIARFQAYLPFNPLQVGNLSPDLAFNVAVSFVTNTNWQSYSGETSLSFFTQMAGLTVQNFVSAATGIALALALTRGFTRHSVQTLGNFWVDLTRGVLYILLPVSFIVALFLVWQGVPQNMVSAVDVMTLEGAKQTIAQGPAASQIAIKMLGTNGGGFFNANAAHPYENPTALANYVQMILMICIAAGLTNVFGRMARNALQGWALFGVLMILSFMGAAGIYAAEAAGNPNFGPAVDQQVTEFQSGGNMEGKETRFGIVQSALFANLTTDAACGATNSAHDSLTPLGGMIALLNIHIGEIIFGGVGSGLYGMLLFAIVAMFIAGLMVGRTPEYAGNKLEAREVKMTMLALLMLPVSSLGFTALATVTNAGLMGISNAGPHGFGEILYAYTSATGNNGSAFAGLNANTAFYNITLGLAMLLGRYGVIVPMMAVAGSLASKKVVPLSSGTFPADNGVFVALLIAVILVVGGLVFFPVLALGPVIEHVMMNAGTLF